MRKLSIIASFAFACALVITGLLASATAAQDATPEGEMMDDMAVECTLEPRVLDDVMAIFGTPAPEGAGEATSIAENDAAMGQTFELPAGEAADEDVVAAAKHAIEQQVACFNAGDILAGWDGLTDEYLQFLAGRGAFDEDQLAQIEAGPTPRPDDEKTVILGFGDVLVLEDGRVSVVWSYRGPSVPGEGIDGAETDMTILKDVDGVWLVDQYIPNLESQLGIFSDTMGTPEADGMTDDDMGTPEA